MARTTTDEDRKQAYGVSLTKAQREVFVNIGASRWLQATLDRIAQETPRVRPAAKKKARA